MIIISISVLNLRQTSIWTEAETEARYLSIELCSQPPNQSALPPRHPLLLSISNVTAAREITICWQT